MTNTAIVACEIFRNEIEYLKSSHTLDIPVEYLEIASHNDSDNLRRLIQSKIDGIDEKYTRILLFYGLCGNGTSGISSGNRTLVIPKAHDCCTILLGSRERFLENFGDNLSAEWTSNTYYEKKGWGSMSDNRGLEQLGLNMTREEYIEHYGEEDGSYLWETLRPKTSDEVVFISLPETRNPRVEEAVRKEADVHGKSFRLLEGSLNLLRKLIMEEWDDDILVVPPGNTIQPSYDEEVIKGVQYE